MNAAFNPSGPRQGSLTRTILLLKGPVLFLSLLSGYASDRKGMRGKDSGRREKAVQKPAFREHCAGQAVPKRCVKEL